MTGPFTAAARARLAHIAEEGQWRAPRSFDARGPAGRLADPDAPIVSFASNDYLGLSVHPEVIRAAHAAIERWGTGSGASRLVTGTRPVHHDLEEALAAWKGTEAAVCFPTGFAANLGVLSVFGTSGTRIVSDALNHASIVDGCRMARATVSIYRHADVAHLEAILAESDQPTLVVTDTVFSMDGDTAPLAAIAALCRRHRALLVVDEAHAALGPHPGAETLGDLEVLRVGTLSKTLGSLGGFVAGPRALIDLLVNTARSYIFTTAPSPADAAAALAALGVLCSPEGTRLQDRLRGHVAAVAPGRSTPIIPVVLGSEDRAVEASAALLAEGLWVPAIRPPTVPVGTSRLRVTLSAAHTEDQVARLVAALAAFGPVEGDPTTAVPRPPVIERAGAG